MSAPATYALPARLDLKTAAKLTDDLRARLGADLTLDAGATTHLGTPGLQVLLAAAKSWRASGQSLSLEGVHPGLHDQLAQFGLSPADLTAEENGEPGEPPGELPMSESRVADLQAPQAAEAADPQSDPGGASPWEDVREPPALTLSEGPGTSVTTEDPAGPTMEGDDT